MKTVIQRFIAGDRKLQSTVDDYIVGVRGESSARVAELASEGELMSCTFYRDAAQEDRHRRFPLGRSRRGQVLWFVLSFLPLGRRADLPLTL